MKLIRKTILFCLASIMAMPVTQANEREELLELKNTITNLIDELVTAGVLEEEKADLMKQTAAAKAKVQAAEEAAAEAEAETEQQLADSEAVRVQYVPEHVKQEIRDSVRAELRQEVVGDVMSQAKNERWGVPDALPEWVNRLKLSGDIRLRHQTDLFSDANDLDTNGDGFRDVEPDFLALNEAQQNLATAATVQQDPNEFFEERERTRDRLRERVRLGIDAEVTTNLKFGARITTGNIRDPVSTNQTLGNTGERFDVQLDRAFIKYTDLNYDAYPWLTFYGGRFKNPFYSSDLVYDSDLNFQGLAFRYQYNLAGSDSLMDLQDDSKTLFMTLGAFPLDEFEVSADDKWLFGGQLGSEITFDDQSKFTFAISYYDYHRIRGRRNVARDGAGTRVSFQKFDFTAPEFLQGGNTMFDIRNDFDTVDPTIPLDTALYALAPDFNLLNFTGSYGWTGLAPVHLVFTGDFVKNIGYDKDEIIDRINEGGNGTAQVFQDQLLSDPASQLESRTLGYSLKLTAGWPSVLLKGRWQVFGGYKYIQRDAVLDAFNDSDFHLGGTNAKGFIIGGKYGINDNAWLRGRWMSTDSIDGPDVGIDILQFDFNARF